MAQIAVENKMQLGQLLVSRGVVTDEQIQQALAAQKDSNHRKLLGELLVELNFCTENQIQSEVSQFIDLLFKVYADFGFTEIIIKKIPGSFGGH